MHQAAFALVISKARGGAIGAAGGIALLCLVGYTLGGPAVNYGGLGPIGAIFGAVIGGVVSGEKIGRIGAYMFLGSAFGLFGGTCLGLSNYRILATTASGVALGFLLGAAREFYSPPHSDNPPSTMSS
jgi:hypothetical protein